MTHLFTPITLKNVTLRNRIVMAPMCMFKADATGEVTPWHVTHYETRAIGGAGLILVEATAVEPNGRISDRDLGIWSDAHMEGLKALVDRVHAHGAKIGIQLAHAGRKCTVEGAEVVAPSAICFDSENPHYVTPKEMTEADITRVANAFADAAVRAESAGFDAIEIHGAHGYLISTFLSPLTNTRTDAYGPKSPRFLQRILEAVSGVWPEDKPISLRISAIDYAEGGNTPEILSPRLNDLKSSDLSYRLPDIINVSSGGVIAVSVPSYDGYQVAAADVIKRSTGFPVMAGGRLRHPEMVDEIIRSERADLIFIGRQLLIEPYWPLSTAAALGVDIDYCPKPYSRWQY